MELIGLAGIMALLEVSRQRADQLTRQKGFPEPAALVDGRQRVWDRADIERWAHDTGRTK